MVRWWTRLSQATTSTALFRGCTSAISGCVYFHDCRTLRVSYSNRLGLKSRCMESLFYFKGQPRRFLIYQKSLTSVRRAGGSQFKHWQGDGGALQTACRWRIPGFSQSAPQNQRGRIKASICNWFDTCAKSAAESLLLHVKPHRWNTANPK